MMEKPTLKLYHQHSAIPVRYQEYMVFDLLKIKQFRSFQLIVHLLTRDAVYSGKLDRFWQHSTLADPEKLRSYLYHDEVIASLTHILNRSAKVTFKKQEIEKALRALVAKR